MSTPPKRNVVALGSPYQPADQGLSSLGLIMALTGSVLAPLVGAVTLMQLQVASLRADAWGSDHEGLSLWWFAIGAASVVRSLVHRMAGVRLWRDTPTDPPALSGLTTYLAISAGHTALWLAFLKLKMHVPAAVLLGMGIILMAWPVAIWAVTRLPRFRALGDRPPPAEDNGFEGLAILMAILGVSGLLWSLMLLVLGWRVREADMRWTANILLLCGLGLTVRSALHAWVGVKAVRGSAVEATDDFLRYGNVGLAIGAGAGGLFLLSLFVSTIDFFALAFGVAVMLSLMAWPAIVRRFVSWRHLADVVNDAVRRRSPDAGITALGWLLLGTGTAALA